MTRVGEPWRRRAFTIGSGLLALIVVGPVLVIARLHSFDGLYGQDAFAYADYGLGPLRAALLAGNSPPYFALPPGYPLLVALLSVVFGPNLAVAQAVAIVAGASIPVLVALLAREVFPERGARLALLAGVVAAVAGQLWQSSLVTMSDTPALAAATLGALAACRYQRTGARRWLVLAATGLAAAVETRLIFVAMAAVFGGLALRRLRADARAQPVHALAGATAAMGVAVLILAPSGIAMLGAVAHGRAIPFVAELGVAGIDPLTPFRSTFQTADGHLGYRWPMLPWYVLQAVHWYWLGAIGLAVPVGLAAVIRPRTLHATEVATLIAWPGLVFAILLFYPYQNPRFFLAMLPPIAILAAGGLEAGWRAIRHHVPAVRAVALAAIAVAFGANFALAWRYADGFATRQASDVAAIRRLEARVPASARVVSIGATPALRHDGVEVTELYNLSIRATQDLVASGPLYVLVDADSMRTQWAGTQTGRAFEVLGSAPGFDVIDRAGAWTLFGTGR